VGPSNFFKGWDWCSGYSYRDSVIIGFPQLHLSGTGIGDLGDILIMPYMGEIKLNKGIETQRFSGYSSQFSHENEKARPGYYSVKLDDYGIEVELTATERVGYHRYKFPQKENARIIIDLSEGLNDKSTDTYIELADQYTIKGYRSSSGWAKKQQVFFAVKSSVPLKNFLIFDDTQKIAGKKGKGASIKGLLTFEKAPEEISLKVGISPVSAENALANIKAEIPAWDFDTIKNRALDLWEKELAKIEIETDNEADKRIFYTSLYHAMVHPSLFNDHNGDYMGSDWKIYRKAPFENYTILSLWDTYRAAHPLFTLTNPDRVGDFVNSMLAIFDQTGALPIWHLRGYDTGTMVGISSFQVITEACMKGIKGFDAEKAYNALKTTAMSDLRGLNYVRDLKPIPSDVMTNRPVAMALEYAIGDACIALMAKKLGKTDDYEYFRQRAENYKLYYDEKTGFFRGKNANGSWNPVFDPLKSKRPYATDYAEGNAWQYLWLVPQDLSGLIELLGGEAAFIDRLDQFFSLDSNPNDPDVLIDLTGQIGQYAHGNEPSHHIAYMYAYAGRQWKTARLVRKIMKEFYRDQPDGIIGNEDCGQMSAWYIFSSLGFYPVLTASGDYVFGSPLFDKATVSLENGKKFTVEAVNNSSENIYIQSVELNGKNYPFTFITHRDILNGGVLKFTMGKNPNYKYGKDPVYRPHDGGDEILTARPYTHPGMSQTEEDLIYMKQQANRGEEPWKTAFGNLKKATSLDFKPEPFTHISVGPYGANSIGGREFDRSAAAAYNHALMWYITDDKRYAGKAIEILNAWSYRLWDFDANNAKLNVGLSAPQFLNAAEILKHTNSGWTEKDEKQFERLVLTVFYPTIKDFFTEANGNWDASIIHTMLCIGIYTDNPDIFNRGLERFHRGTGNSGITKYIYPNGQCQETTRDWAHVQLGIGEFAKAAQVAWTQGIDLYSVAGDRLALGFEYTTKYLSGGEIPVFGILSEREKGKYRDITVIVRPGESIQEAIDKNKLIVLEKGVHTLTEPLKMKSGITLAGKGKETILFLSPEQRTMTITNATDDLHDITIRDLLIEGAVGVKTNDDPNHDRRTRSYMSAPSREGILFSAGKDGEMKNIRLENLTVQNCTKSGVSVKGASGVKVINCDFSDNGASVVPGAGFHHNLLLTHVSDGEIRNSRFDASPWGSGIDVTFCRNIIITGNEAARNALSGIRCADSENIRITGNLVEGNDLNGITQDTMMDASKDVEISNNLSQNNGRPDNN
ncbi:MAG: GH92 family glycosyl hydrolase, partial [Candidatus Symbiothrix sp.]|nr:GH92 family glycosyl hydrolase [Candidatus Symbiothrix sp.]